MKLSIVVPVYNMSEGNKLRYCLDSLVNQTISDYEIIAVDDASTDNSLEILKEYESKYPWKFKAVQSYENLKQGGARNKGIALARGKWIGFVDSDDWVAHDMYEKLIKKAEATGADVVGCDYCMCTEQTMKPGKLMPNNTSEQTGVLGDKQYKLLVMNPGSMVIKVYLKSVIDDMKKYGIKFGVYLSPWDRHEATYGSGEAYDDYFCNQLTELMTNYGELYTVWFDGACGEGPNGKKQHYDWNRYYALIRKLQPNAVISVSGPDVRWCGNEAGFDRL